MSTQSLIQIKPDDLCPDIDHYISCIAKQYMDYERYKIGSKPDIDHVLHVERIRRVVCEGPCYLCEDDRDKLNEYVNKLIHS